MDSVFDIRPARPSDCAATYAVFHAAVHQGAAAFYDARERAAWAPAVAPENWGDMICGGHGLIAHHGDDVLGFMTLGHDGFLDLAYVAPDQMGAGVADALYLRQIAWARGRRLPLLTTEASWLAQRFFTRHGWQTLARQSVIRNGVALTNFRMAFAL